MTAAPKHPYSAVRAALYSAKSLGEAAAKLGCSVRELEQAAGHAHLWAMFDRVRRGGEPRPKPHSGFVDMTGKRLAGIEVLRRAGNEIGNARWLCRWACGHEGIQLGIKLRAAEKAGGKVRCPVCLKAIREAKRSPEARR